MVKNNPLRFDVEDIPDEDEVFRNVHVNLLRNWAFPDKIPPNVFMSDEDGMSCDWAKYSTPQMTQERARCPEKNGVIQMNVGATRSIKFGESALDVKHDPIEHPQPNRAHSLVIGIHPPNKAKIRSKLQEI